MKHLVIVMLLVSRIAICDAPPKLKTCDLAIQACKAVVAAEDVQITTLKSHVSTLESSLVDAQSSPIVPTWLIITSSVLAGIALGYTVGHH